MIYKTFIYESNFARLKHNFRYVYMHFININFRLKKKLANILTHVCIRAFARLFTTEQFM